MHEKKVFHFILFHRTKLTPPTQPYQVAQHKEKKISLLIFCWRVTHYHKQSTRGQTPSRDIIRRRLKNILWSDGCCSIIRFLTLFWGRNWNRATCDAWCCGAHSPNIRGPHPTHYHRPFYPAGWDSKWASVCVCACRLL